MSATDNLSRIIRTAHKIVEELHKVINVNLVRRGGGSRQARRFAWTYNYHLWTPSELGESKDARNVEISEGHEKM